MHLIETLARTAFFFAVVVVVFAPLEWLEHRRAPRVQNRATDLLHFWLNPLLIAPAAGLGFGLLEAYAPGPGPAWFSTMPLWAQTALVFVVGETNSYWLHRALHRVPWLWRMHRVHHSAAPLDFLAAHRQHPAETVLFLAAINVPAILLGFDFGPVVAVVALQKLHTVFVHADIVTTVPGLRQLVAFPHWHRQHHHIDGPAVNFAGLFPWLDRLFGTYADPEPCIPVGVAAPGPETYFAQLLAPFAPTGPSLPAPAARVGAERPIER